MGAAILKEFIDLDIQKREQAERSKKEAKAAADAVADKVGLSIYLFSNDESHLK